MVLVGFLAWEKHRRDTGQGALLDPVILRVKLLRKGLVSFFFQYLLQAGLFFAVPLFLSIALGLSAIETGVRILPLSITLVIAAVGIPKVFPKASPRLVCQLGFFALFLGLVVFIAALDAGAGAEIVTWPMLLAGLGIGMLASQLGAVTVSALPDEQSGEVGGLQNTFSNLGISIGTAFAGAILMSALTASFFVRDRGQPGGAERPVLEGAGRTDQRCALHLRRRPRGSTRRTRASRVPPRPPSSTRTRKPVSMASAPHWPCSPSSRSSHSSSAEASPPHQWAHSENKKRWKPRLPTPRPPRPGPGVDALEGDVGPDPRQTGGGRSPTGGTP